MSTPAETPATAPADQPTPAVPYAPERRTAVERIRFAAALAASACCDAYGTRVLPIQGGAR